MLFILILKYNLVKNLNILININHFYYYYYKRHVENFKLKYLAYDHCK